jgi:peptidoglycan hydrolase-like amidase
LPLLPYFSCSAGFTRTAKEKRGRQDTPYLSSVYDFSACPTFEGHGVGLAGKGAEYLAQKGLTAAEILKWYYTGVEIANL